MPDPVSISILGLLGSLISNWLSGSTQALVDDGGRRLWDAICTRVGKLPKNYDLLKASHQSLATSILILQQSLDRYCNINGDKICDEERHWIDILRGEADRLAKDADKKDLPGKSAKDFARFDELFILDESTLNILAVAGRHGMRDTTMESGRKSVGTSGELFHSAVEKWLCEIIERENNVNHTIPPEVLGVWLRNGFDYHAPISFFKTIAGEVEWGKSIHVTLFQIWSQCFFDLLKIEQRPFRAYILGLIQDLSLELVQMKILLIETGGILDAATSMDGKLAKLTELTSNGFAEVRSRLNRQEKWLGILSSFARDNTKNINKVGKEIENFRDLLNRIAKGVNEQHQLAFREGPIVEQAKSTAEDVKIRDLYYERRWLPDLLAREREIGRLYDFLNRSEKFLWWGIVGEGGIGKSRLALELVLQARERGWRAGFLERGANLLLSDTNRFDLWCPGTPTLIIIDDASDHGSSIPTALAKLRSVAEQFENPLRILLLDRPGAVKPLFSELSQREESETARDCDQARLACHRQTVSTFGEKEDLLWLGTVTAGDQILFLQKVIRQAGLPDAAWPPELASITGENTNDLAEILMRVTDGGRPLLLLLFGISMARRLARGQDAMDYKNPLSLLDDMLTLEVRERWRKRLPAGPQGDQLLFRFQQAIAFVTLCRGLDLSVHDDVAALRKAVGFGDWRDLILIDALGQVLGESRSNGEDWTSPRRLRPLEPDLVAERFILRGGILALDSAPGFDEPPFSATALIPDAVALSPRGVAQFIALALRDYPQDAVSLLVAYIPHLPDPAIDSASLTGETSAFIKAIFDASPMIDLWVATASLFRAKIPLNASGVPAAFRNWAIRGEQHLLVSMLGVLTLRSVLAHEADAASEWFREGPDSWLLDIVYNPAGLSSATSQLFAISSFCYICAFTTHQHWDDLFTWVKALQKIAATTPQVEIQSCLAFGATMAMVACNACQNWDDFAAWGKVLREVAAAHPQIAEIQTMLTLGAVIAVAINLDGEREKEALEWLVVLRNSLPEKLECTDQVQEFRELSERVSALQDAYSHPTLEEVTIMLDALLASNQSYGSSSSPNPAPGCFLEGTDPVREETCAKSSCPSLAWVVRELSQTATTCLTPRPQPVVRREDKLPIGITDARSWSDAAIWNEIERLKSAYLDWKKTTDEVKTWWEAFENDNRGKPMLVLRLVEELKIRKGTITELFCAHADSNTDNIQAVLDQLDYTRLKNREEENARSGFKSV